MNGNRVVIDTNIILYLFSGDKTLANFLDGKDVFVSVITELELLGYPNLTIEETNQLKHFLSECAIVDLNTKIKETYITLKRKYKIKLGDACIAATAISLDLPLLSADKDLAKISELQFTLYTI